MLKVFLIKIIKLLFTFYIIFFFFNIRTLFYSSTLYSTGFMNIYQSGFLYFSEITLLMCLFFIACFLLVYKRYDILFCNYWRLKKYEIIFFVLILFSFIFSIFLAVDKVVVFIYLMRFFEACVFYFLISRELISLKNVVYIYLGIVSFFVFIGIFQFILQKSLGLSFLGESIISNSVIGVSKISFLGLDFLRSYSIFSHPNIFSAILLFSLFILMPFVFKKPILFIPLFGFFILALIMTFSRVAISLFIFFLIIYLFINLKKINYKYLSFFVLFLFGILLFSGLGYLLYNRFLLGDSFGSIERVLYLNIAYNSVLNNLFGIGAGNFTIQMQNFSNLKIFPWFFQPVHNSYFLILTEFGFIGLFIFISLISSVCKKLLSDFKIFSSNKQKIYIINIFIFVSFLVLAFFDHYFITSYQVQMLLALIFALFIVDKDRFIAIYE